MKQQHFTLLQEVADIVGGYAYSSDAFGVNYGIRIATITDINSNTEIRNWNRISFDEYNKFAANLLLENDILLGATHHNYWDLGRVLFIGKSNYPITFNQRTFCIRSKKVNSMFLYIALQSTFVRLQIENLGRGNNQLNLSKYDLERLQIPMLPQSFQFQVEQLVKSAHAKLDESRYLYTEAENMLLEELGLKDWQPKNENINVKTLSESFLSSGRLDAEYYQSKYDEIEREIASYYDALEIGNLCFVNQKNTKPKDGVQYKYIELSNINSIGEITGCTIDYGENLPTRARQVVKSGDVIVSSIEGSLDSCALVTPEYDNAFCSTGFYIIRSKIITSETLLVLMKLKPIQQLLKKGCSGTILTAINYDNFCNIIIPVPDGKIQTEISSKIQRCFALKAESKCLLEEAKKMVENEIEKGGK